MSRSQTSRMPVEWDESRMDCMDPMGPAPATNAAVLADLGLSAGEIARYYGVDEARIHRLLRD